MSGIAATDLFWFGVDAAATFAAPQPLEEIPS